MNGEGPDRERSPSVADGQEGVRHERIERGLRFELMADSAPVMIWIADAENRGTYFNKPWLDFTGRTLDEERGEGWLEAVHPDDRASCLATCREEFEARRPFTIEFRLRNGAGEYRWVLDRGVPRYGPGGEFAGYIGSCVDITDRKEAEEQRDRLLVLEQLARREAEEASRIKDEFLATISHELRTPLNSVLGWARLLASGKLDGEQARKAVQVIERNAKIQAQLIEDLLDVSRIITGKLRIEAAPLALAPAVQSAVDSARPSAEAKGILLEADLGATVATVVGDARRLQQIVMNLLSNAIKFTPRDGRISVRIERSDAHVELVVVDTGRGIHPEFIEHVFDRFRQAEAVTTRSHGGLGLGLAIVRHLVELHGGAVEAASDGEGKGAEFRVRLPHAESGDVPFSVPGSLRSGEAPALGLLEGLSVLVVDDELDAREMLAAALAGEGASVVTAASCGEALEAIRRRVPDALVSDIAMPVEDGYTLIRRVRSLAPERGGSVPALALSAYAQLEDRVRAVAAGFQVHVAKPVEPLELAAAIASLVLRSRSAGQFEIG